MGWSKYVSGVTERQALALDRKAREVGLSDGQELLSHVGNCSPSKLSRIDRPTIQGLIDLAFSYEKKRSKLDSIIEMVQSLKKPESIQRVMEACAKRLEEIGKETA